MKNSFVKNVSYSLVANVFSLIVSVLSVLMLPKVLDTIGYGHYQIYVFYAGYVGYLQLGWIDGIYLRYGGQYYEKLEKPKFATQFKYFNLLSIIITLLILVIALLLNNENTITYMLVAIYALLYLPRSFLQILLQTTNRIKNYALITLIGRSVFGIAIIVLMITKSQNFIYYVIADLVGRCSALIYSLYSCRDICSTKANTFNSALPEIKENIFCGIKLMVSNLGSLVMIGVIRLFIQIQWSVETFGKVSLTISISNLLLTCITAVSVTLFPMLKRLDKQKMIPIYHRIQVILTSTILFAMIFYYPFSLALGKWLPAYKESIRLAALLFPMCLYECKMNLQINTFLKTLRKEKAMLIINISMACLSALLAFVAVFIFKNLYAAVFLIVVMSATKCIVSEVYLSKNISISAVKPIAIELIFSTAFIIFNWFIQGVVGFALYVLLFSAYVFFVKEQFLSAIGKKSQN